MILTWTVHRPSERGSKTQTVYPFTPPLLHPSIFSYSYALLTLDSWLSVSPAQTPILSAFYRSRTFFLVWNNIVWLLLSILVDCALVSTPSSPCCYIKQSFPTIHDTLSLTLAAIWLALMGLTLLKPHIDCTVEDFKRFGQSFRQCGCCKLACF